MLRRSRPGRKSRRPSTDKPRGCRSTELVEDQDVEAGKDVCGTALPAGARLTMAPTLVDSEPFEWSRSPRPAVPGLGLWGASGFVDALFGNFGTRETHGCRRKIGLATSLRRTRSARLLTGDSRS